MVVDPLGSETVSNRVLRGGARSFYARYCRSAGRASDGPTNRFNDYGFRCVLVR
jgi:formylglycine-generating enzyme required for sulfatase activity